LFGVDDMKKLLKYMKSYRLEAILGPLFKLLEAIFELIVPLIVARIVNVGINEGAGLSYILKMSLIMIGLGVVGLGCSITAQYFSAKAAVGFSSTLRHELFVKAQSLSYKEIDELGTATMITRMTNDVNQVQNGVNLFLRLFLRSPFVVFGALIMAFIVDAKVAIIFAVVILVLSIIIFTILLVSQPKYKVVQKQLDGVLKSTRENLNGVRVIRAFNKEERELEEFNGKITNLRKSQKRVGYISSLMNPLTYAIINVGIIGILYLGGSRVESGVIIQGDVLALYNYMLQILTELIKLANLVITISKSLASADRIAKTLDMESSLVRSDEPRKENMPFVEFDNVSMKYNSNEESLSNVNFVANRGESIGIIGGTGSGKTTLINLLAHLYDVSSGAIYIDGRNVTSISDEELHHIIGIVPQKAVLFKGTIRSNMCLRKENASDEEILEALTVAQAKDFVLKKENGIDAVVEQEGKNFSGGQRQRLTIARALVGNPIIVVLDDSASALDFLTDLNLRKALKTLKNNPLVFIISQRTSSIAHCDKIIVLDDGKVVGMGKHDDLLNNCEVYKEIYDSQFKKEE